MNIEQLREYCLSIKGASECLPFDDTTLVFKVMEKMFACLPLEPRNNDFNIILKCDPERAVDLREHHSGITPAFHFNKKYWISIFLDSGVPDELTKELIHHSVDEVIKKLPKKKQEEYHNS
ncbi:MULTISPECIES: MmcQ/YjbR family DNA-binding protein [unclassified Dysgonomonas]|uniref:MmcQ/YjbR family DNA-binding protein n=1 Tax=unclassified Dysgonomonas TaxID=2630389 RepID=UPI0013EA75AC|nr:MULTISPECIES: MmcQ/YjbR family DNA-binding protein [unclassified Dysgonomonas]